MIRLVFCIGVVVTGTPRNCRPQPPAPTTSSSELAGVRFIEHMTGGARTDERVPMIIVLHPMGGDPADMLQMFKGYQGRARLVLPYGHPSGGKYLWYESVREDVAAEMVTRETDRLAAAISALTTARPTTGKPIVTGFSQGAIMTFALAVTHPDEFAAAFPISGRLPPALYPFAMRSGAKPLIIAFHGAADLAVPTQSARASIAELKRAGFSAELREYAGIEHDISDEELKQLLELIRRTADAFTP